MKKFDLHKISKSPEPKSNTEFKELEHYRIEHIIDEGTFGKVKLGIHLPTKEKVAIKILEKSKIEDASDTERIHREIYFLKKLNHVNIIKIYEIIENKKNYYLIMEYLPGGELFNYIVKKKRLDDDEASYFFTQIINGLEFIHKNNIVHRDLKPENLLITNDKVLKIIDFGLSNSYRSGQLLQTPCGSPCYASPEMILGKKYSGLLIDIWSCGIILYAMVCGYLPFEDKNNEKLYKKVLECKLEFPSWLNETTKDLILKMLTVDTKKRIKLEEIKTHAFYKKGEILLKKEEHNSVELNKIEEFVIDMIIEMGLSKDELLKNLKEKKYNNITTTYHLLLNKYLSNPELMEKVEDERRLLENNKYFAEEKIKSLNSSNNTSNHSNISQVQNKSKQTFFLSQLVSNNNSILDTYVKIEKPVNPFKNKNSTEISNNTSNIINNSISENKNATPSPVLEKAEKPSRDSNNNTKLEKEEMIPIGKKDNIVNESSDQISSIANENVTSKEIYHQNYKLSSPKKISPSDIVESNIFLRKCIIAKNNNINTNPTTGSKFNNSMSYDYNLDSTVRSNAETHKNHSPPEIACHSLRENILNLKKKSDQFGKIVKANLSDSPDISLSKNDKTNSIDNDAKHVLAIKKLSDMDIIFEEKEDQKKNKDIERKENIWVNQIKEPAMLSPRENNLMTIQPKIENFVIDFKKKTKTNDVKTNHSKNSNSKSPEPTKKAVDVKNRMNSLNRTKERSPPQHVLKNSLHKKDANSLNLEQILPLNSKTIIPNVNHRSPERKGSNTGNIANTEKLDVKPPILNSLINHHGERNAAQRSISPGVSFNNTTNSFKAMQENMNNEMNGNKDKDNINNSRKSPIQNKNSLNYPYSIEVSLKKPNNINPLINMNYCTTKRDSKIIGSPNNKKEKSPLIIPNVIFSDDKKKQKNLNNNSNTIKTIANDTARKEIARKETNDKIGINIDKNLGSTKDRVATETGFKRDNKKDTITNKTSNNFKTNKTLLSSSKNNDELEDFIKSKQNITEFACCTISNITEIQEKIKTHCANNKITIKDIGNSKYECSTDNFVVGIEFTNVKNMKFMKLYQITGSEVQGAKEVLKALLNLAL